MAEYEISNGTGTGQAFAQIMSGGDIQPGDSPSYELCKLIYRYHPLGAKMARAPIKMAQSQERKITINGGPEDRLRKAFEDEWLNLENDKNILNVGSLSRVYGVATVIVGAVNIPTDKPIDPFKWPKLELYFNVLDPLNTSGSLVLNQDPNAPDFLKYKDVTAAGQVYHRSRACVLMNEEPVFLDYTGSAFGYVGCSVYQRALYPLKTFIESMRTDDLVTRKAGVLIAKLKQITGVITNLMQRAAGRKRDLLKEATTNNVINIGPEDSVETLDLKNADTAMSVARKNVLENVAVAADMPAKLLNSETFAEGFGEGTEDAKNVARYIDNIRKWLNPAYAYFDEITMHRAWSPEFYACVQADFPEYQAIPYEQAFYKWKNSFSATWPSLLIEPESEQVKVEDVKLKAIVAVMEVMTPLVDPTNKAEVMRWASDNLSEMKLMFSTPLMLEFDELLAFLQKQQQASEEAASQLAQQDTQQAETPTSRPKPFAVTA